MNRALGIIAFLFALAVTLFIAHLIAGCSVDCTMRTHRAKEQACLDASSLAAFEECIRR